LPELLDPRVFAHDHGNWKENSARKSRLSTIPTPTDSSPSPRGRSEPNGSTRRRTRCAVQHHHGRPRRCRSALAVWWSRSDPMSSPDGQAPRMTATTVQPRRVGRLGRGRSRVQQRSTATELAGVVARSRNTR
jgi:hypothetical protein